jgi:hypothetical protein
MEHEEKLFNPDLRWHPGTGPVTSAHLEAMRTRHANAIRPIPSATALGYDHLMADADRGALLAEVERLRAEREKIVPWVRDQLEMYPLDSDEAEVVNQLAHDLGKELASGFQ